MIAKIKEAVLFIFVLVCSKEEQNFTQPKGNSLFSFVVRFKL